MQYLRAPVSTICIGQAASMGRRPARRRRQREALSAAEQPDHDRPELVRLLGNTPDVEIQMRENPHLVNRLLEILAQHTGQSVEKVKHDSDRDYFMSPRRPRLTGSSTRSSSATTTR
jgi:ATP-dependent Clp protease protease subunit